MFTLAEVLAVAEWHPFYNDSVQYPPDPTCIQQALHEADAERVDKRSLESFPLLTKQKLYRVIERLLSDTSPENGYRRSAYLSTTGGGSGGQPLMFATDARENRTHRAEFGEFMRVCRVVEPGDMVLTTHTAGYLYRSLDLVSEILENAGASVLCVGGRMEPTEVSEILAHYHANVLAGDSSQIVQLVHYISTIPSEQREEIRLDKVIYTSDALTEAQEAHIVSVLDPVKILSILGSAEAGPFAISNPELTGEQPPKGSRDFLFDTRAMVIEIHDRSVLEDDSQQPRGILLPDGEQGIIVQTSLQRLHNPLVRYITGDIGSLHPIIPPAGNSVCATIPETELHHLRILRLAGRDRRFSFKWFGEYFEFQHISALMHRAGSGVLQWQIILDRLASSPQGTLEVRVLRAAADGGGGSGSSGDNMAREEFVQAVQTFFWVFPENRHLFRIVFVDGLEGFERSSTGGKVIKFVDRFNR